MNNCIFIIGCGHSGTTILNKILINHKNIYGLNYESELFLKKDDLISKNKLNILDKERILSNKKWLCEKTPRHVYHIENMFKLTINPKIIIITRDGRDVVASLFKRYCDFEKSYNRWINDNIEWLNSKYKNNFHVLKYENFIKDPKLEIKKICDYLEEEYDENILNYKKDLIEIPKEIIDKPLEGNPHKLLRKYQVNQDIYDGSNRWINDLTKEQLEILYSNEKFMNIMKELGYEIINPT